MEIYVTTVYVICDEVLRILEIQDDPQTQMSNAEVMTFAIASAKYFSGNYKLSRYLCKKLRFFPNILTPDCDLGSIHLKTCFPPAKWCNFCLLCSSMSKNYTIWQEKKPEFYLNTSKVTIRGLSHSRLNRRIHKIPWFCWNALFRFLALFFNQLNESQEFAVDSFPVACCQKNRIDKRKFFLKKQYLGYAASKKRHFCGIKVHMVVTSSGKPIEVLFRPGAVSDVKVLWEMELDIPLGSKLYADGAYNSFDLEDILKDEQILLLAKRGCRAKNRIRTPIEEKEISSKRQIVETTFSCITGLLPRTIKACTEHGFMVKVFCSILAYSASFLCNNPLI